MNVKLWSAGSPWCGVEDVCEVLNLNIYMILASVSLLAGYLSPRGMVVHCEPFLQERYLLLRIKADPQSRLILFQSWCDVVGISGVKGLGVERHIQDCCVLVSSLSVLVIQSYHNPPSSISRVNPCNVRARS